MKFKLATLVLGAVIALNTFAADPQLRIGTLAPKNSLYHRQLMALGEAWRTAQGGHGKYLVYPDGSQGGETDMVRRMRIGQLQGGLLSVVGLREIEPSIAALQNMPMMFKSWDEVDYVREKMRPAMEKKFLEKGFVVLAWGDAGWVRFFSKEPALRPDDLGYTPVPLETADILPAIQTGMINAVPSTPYFALATQIYTTANNMLDMNWAPVVGALIITRKAWDELTPEGQVAVREAGAKAGVQLRAKARQEVDEAVDAMKKRGLTVNQPNAAQIKEWNALADGLYPRIRGKLVPAEQFDEVVRHLKDFRAGKR